MRRSNAIYNESAVKASSEAVKINNLVTQMLSKHIKQACDKKEKAIDRYHAHEQKGEEILNDAISDYAKNNGANEKKYTRRLIANNIMQSGAQKDYLRHLNAEHRLRQVKSNVIDKLKSKK